MKQLRLLLLPHGWDASQSQGYPQQYVAGNILHTWVNRGNAGGKVSCLRKRGDGRDWTSNLRPSYLEAHFAFASVNSVVRACKRVNILIGKMEIHKFSFDDDSSFAATLMEKIRVCASVIRLGTFSCRSLQIKKQHWYTNLKPLCGA